MSFTLSVVLLISPFVGSFLGLLSWRLPQGEPVVFSRSDCPQCGALLPPGDLIPIVSWMWLRGFCRYCSTPISIFYPLIELASLFIVLWAAAVVDDRALITTCFLGWTLLPLAIVDWRQFLLPDVLTLPLLVGGTLVAYFLDRAHFADHLFGVIAGYAFIELIAWAYRRIRDREGIGRGDAKLLAAAGAWVSWSGLPSVVFIAAVSGLLVTLMRSLGRKPLSLAQRLPFGTFLAFGLWIVWLYGPFVIG